MVEESPEIIEARSNVEKAIKEFVAVHSRQHSQEPPYVMAWSAVAEYLSTETINRKVTQALVIFPPDQLISTSMGLQQMGMHRFNVERKP